MRIQKGQSLKAAAIAFDMDGTLVDSRKVIELIWREWASRYNIDPAKLLASIHGQRSIETVRRWAPADIDIVAETRELASRAANALAAIKPVAGAIELVNTLPEGRWAVVTSADASIAIHWLKHLGFSRPPILIASTDVASGKPSPEGYLRAADRLRVKPHELVIFEDAENGFQAAELAGGQLVALATLLSPKEIGNRQWIPDFDGVAYRDETLTFN